MIPCFFDPTTTWPVPRVRAAVYVPGFSKDWGFVDFLVDTGAASTVLHPVDAISVGFDATTLADAALWSNKRDVYGVGGTSVNYVLVAAYAFRHDNGQWEKFAAEISVAQLTIATQALPSLMGWDILQKYRLEADWASRHVGLHGATPAPPSP